MSLSVSLHLLLFISVFFLYWLTHVGGFISYLVSVLFRGLEYSCSFVRLYLFLFAFWIICIESFGFRLFLFAFLIICFETFRFHRLFCNRNNFCCIVLVFVWAQKICLRFFESYFKLEILIFLSFVVSFLVDMFKWKTAVKFETL